jgi:hypothetical protein
MASTGKVKKGTFAPSYPLSPHRADGVVRAEGKLLHQGLAGSLWRASWGRRIVALVKARNPSAQCLQNRVYIVTLARGRYWKRRKKATRSVRVHRRMTLNQK